MSVEDSTSAATATASGSVAQQPGLRKNGEFHLSNHSSASNMRPRQAMAHTKQAFPAKFRTDKLREA